MGSRRRRTMLQLCGITVVGGLSGCLRLTGNSNDENSIQDTDGDGVIDSEDYAPRNPEVQRAEQVNRDTSAKADSPTETPAETQPETQPLGEFIIEQGSISAQVTPFSRTESVESAFNYTGFTSELRLQKEDTARLFLYMGPNGLSLGTIIDSVQSDDGGTTSYQIDGLPENGEWVVKDDPRDFEDSDSPAWSWSDGGNTDGGAFRGGLNSDFEIEITVQLNEGRDSPDNAESGTVDRLEFVHGDFSAPDVLDLETGDSAPAVLIRRSG